MGVFRNQAFESKLDLASEAQMGSAEPSTLAVASANDPAADEAARPYGIYTLYILALPRTRWGPGGLGRGGGIKEVVR